MSFSIGIIGLPNVGKSTLFMALTKIQVDASNFPFCTIDPNVGTVAVPDNRVEKVAKVFESKKIVPTVIEFVDIAGLVKNAHKGEGLGNAFLSHIRSVDAVCHVVRKFSDSNVVHISGKVDPESDANTINLELIFADLEIVERRITEIEPKARSGEKEAKELLPIYRKVKDILDQGKLLSNISFTEEETDALQDLQLLSCKPMLYVLNVDESESTTEIPGYLAISAKIESELTEMPKEESQEYLATLGLQKTGLERLISASYHLLDLISFFTGNVKEMHTWTLKKGAKALEAAGKVHSDFQKGFIRADVINWKDLVVAGSENEAKMKGKIRTEGKKYIVQDGDVMYFLATA